ncbi:hypothetical protein [Mucilaginibacter celer]|uniref:Two-component sensor histidine kinase n=1 Tax=Mucilaginibacter celer TaxID=2305508 RepID=A0A494W4U5_9SPHI|nr:hypothetical protein [Mucilaginibacter celer]AYL98813.1 hypothetical protein HYN43_027640 [Mucilaginibacter celer]
MNLKQRFSFIFSSLFSVLLASVMVTVYFLFTHFRQDEFATLLTEKAQTTAKLLIEVKEIDYKMQKLIDSNSVNKLYNENTQIYDSFKKLIYNSNSKLTIDYTDDELDQIKEKGRFLAASENTTYWACIIFLIIKAIMCWYRPKTPIITVSLTISNTCFLALL